MLKPQTPLPWKPFNPNDDGTNNPCTYGIDSHDDRVTVCHFDYKDEPDKDGGFLNIEDMRYAVYAANLLPELIQRLEWIADLPKLPPYQIAREALDLIESYKP